PGEADREEEHRADDRGPSHGSARGIVVRAGQGWVDRAVGEHVIPSVRLLHAGASTGLPAGWSYSPHGCLAGIPLDAVDLRIRLGGRAWKGPTNRVRKGSACRLGRGRRTGEG